jgi:hypothetical protein
LRSIRRSGVAAGVRDAEARRRADGGPPTTTRPMTQSRPLDASSR